MERIAKVFRNNRSQAVRIPKEFELPGDEVSVSRQPDGSLILRPRLRLEALIASLEPLPPEDRLDEILDLEAEDVVL
ncbi:AbrB/MazE/SpoVT family DNA-binding domain-containing protein [Methylobacterium sp. J-048]|uniref:antitoxin n=1 Tax=Methylobacterium sp. J-048 TaxID=2836635 RepID=UPI001FBA9BFD|nr:AbrB/MazE/SpoVT family DNA-binding domain-containing protein [Methylobacterium sp. J-048]MCJ2060354.1 AbrB/MazE/SpoVT family DNA-binding domain-containing protein [Methylobacterium sp. J-048]